MIILIGLAVVLLWLTARSPSWPLPARRTATDTFPRAAVIAPIAGEVPALAAFLDSLRVQDYPDYHVVLVIEEEREGGGDPREAAVQIAALERKELLDGMRVVRAGRAHGSSQKAANLVAGLGAIGDAAVIILVDADARPHRSWLRDLVGPLLEAPEGEVRKPRVTTGFRWYVPGKGLGSLLRSAFSAAALGMVADPRRAFAWGGSLAIRREDLDGLAIGQVWRTALSDDMAVTQAVRAAGGGIRFVPECVIPSFGEITLGAGAEFAVRQVAMLKWGSAILWGTSLAYHAALAATQLGAIAVALGPATVPGGTPGRALAAGILALPTVLAVGRTHARFRSLASRPLARVPGWDRRRWAHVALAPAMTWVMLACHLAAAAKREIDWCGIRYRLGPGRSVSVISGPVATRLESGRSA